MIKAIDQPPLMMTQPSQLITGHVAEQTGID
jgi:hypothetical protein